MTKTGKPQLSDLAARYGAAASSLYDHVLEPQTCSNCKWFRRDKETNQGGCHRYPPVMSAVQGGYTTQFPVVRDDMNCGEYKKAA